MNTTIIIQLDEGLVGRDYVGLDIENKSSEKFIFSYFANVELLSFTDLGWNNLKNNYGYVNPEADGLTIEGHDYRYIPIYPPEYISDFRVVVTGHNETDDGNLNDKCYGAFADSISIR